MIPAWIGCRDFHDTRSKASVKENGKEILFINKDGKEIAKYRVDGCIINSSDGKKSDFLFLVITDKRAFFIELKGNKIESALKQIRLSIDMLKPHLPGFKIEARIISQHGKVPRAYETDYLKLKKYLRQLGGDLVIKTLRLEEAI